MLSLPFNVSPTRVLGGHVNSRYFASSLRPSSTLTTPDLGEEESTIYALSSAPGRAAISVIRISGPACLRIYRALCPRAPLPKPRTAALRRLHDPQASTASEDSILDAGALVLYFPSPRTVTGEDVLELHVHGGPAIVQAVLSALAKCSTADSVVRYAEPGEFTRRAFLNARLDLPQIEALGHTLAAETEQQRRIAVRGSSDALSKRYESWRQALLYARGELEALIDFSEDQHFDESPRELMASVAEQVRDLRRKIWLHVRNASKGELLRNGLRVALLGAPNAGKSSLLNRVVGKEAAIVSTEAGTTRDIVDVGIDLGGWYCKLGDMAGLRSSGGGGKKSVVGAVEQEGIRRAKARALESDVVVAVFSVEESANGPRLAVESEVVEAVHKCLEAGKYIVVAVNKTDLVSNEAATRSLMTEIQNLFPTIPSSRIHAISCKEAADESSRQEDPGNIQAFLQGLVSAFKEIATPEGMDGEHDTSYWQDSLGVTHRQSTNLQRCLEHLDDFLSSADPCGTQRGEAGPLADASIADGGEDVDIVTAAEHLRYAADVLARITGRGEGGDVEDVLGVVFEKFCVGK
ncbi:hypothetical protein VTN31DRAFT_6912 [Thermomyces dupontii]|uniref:uncharacterized protein n=1 Tax=Talaromyces thermophilus TaxID=28565 RepID=UPI003742746D